MSITKSKDRAMQIKKGIAAYAREQEVLLRLMRKCGGSFTERQFDTWFKGREYGTRLVHGQLRYRIMRLSRVGISGDAFLLGGMDSSDWALMLDLLQHMVAAGLVDAKRDVSGMICYSETA